MAETKRRRRAMVTFDVDGTLIASTGGGASNRLHRAAFSHATRSVFSISDASTEAVKHHGQTDPISSSSTLPSTKARLPTLLATEKLPGMKSTMIEYAIKNAQHIGEGLEVLPGVVSLLDAFSSEAVVVGLVTGNLEEIAWMKIEGLGLKKYFSVPNFGGFGSDDTDRGQLVKTAAQRAEQLFPGGFDLRVHVGDTPNDIGAAEFGGARAIGVCTGVFTGEELMAASSGDAVILPDLTDGNSFMKLLGLKHD